VIVPAVLIGGWGLHQFAVSARLQEIELQSGYRRLAADAASQALSRWQQATDDALRPVLLAGNNLDAQLAALLALHPPPGIAQPFLVGSNGAIVMAQAPAVRRFPLADTEPSAGTMPPVALLEARRLEFVVTNHAAAVVAYEGLLAHTNRAVQREAWEGTIGCRLKLDDAPTAADCLARLAVSDRVSLPDPFFLALALRDTVRKLIALGQSAQAAKLLFDLWPECEDRADNIPGFIQLELNELQDSLLSELEPAEAARVTKLSIHRRWEALRLRQQPTLTEETCAWFATCIAQSQQPPVWRYLCETSTAARIVACLPLSGRSLAVAVHVKPNEVAEVLRRELATLPALRELAAIYRNRTGRPVTPPDETLELASPWGQPLRMALPQWSAGDPQAARSNPLLGIGACLAAGVLLIVGGALALARAARRDLALTQLKTDFVSNVSHELKTPLSLVRMFGEMLELGYAKDEAERKEYARIISKESERLTLLINNILDFARIEKGEKLYRAEPVALGDVVREVLDTYRKPLEEAGFTWSAEIPDDLPPLPGDRNALAQAFLNLISNAMKYSDQEKRIEVRLGVRGGELELSVRDWGIGIPRTEHAKIFEKFHRVESGLTRTTRGSGLGLTLTKHMVEGHGGRIELESAPGQGSTFRLVFPLAK
jgi:signal transduction histidine kinase